jgi:hypothetical protein
VTAATDHISYVRKPELAWDISERDPRLFAVLAEQTPGIAELLRAVREQAPVAQTVSPFEGEYYRPSFHNRAFYRSLAGGFVAYKGTEPYARDLEDRYSALSRRRLHFTVFNAIERYPIEEQTVSMGNTFHECESEAAAALAVQQSYFKRYREIAPMPFPIACFRWPADVIERFLASQRPFMSERAYSLTERLVATEGLGGYVYYHSDPKPTRILHIGGILMNQVSNVEDYSAREEALAQHHGIDVGRFMDRYLRLAARLLACGFFPGSMPYMKNGFATDPQNVLTSGAFVDLGNCQAMREVRIDDHFYQNWSFALLTLRRTTRALMTDTFMPFWGMHHDDDPLQSMLAGYVWEQFHPIMREEWAIDPSTQDPRLTKILEQKSPIDGLRESLRGLYQVKKRHGLGNEGKEMPLMFRQKK